MGIWQILFLIASRIVTGKQGEGVGWNKLFHKIGAGNPTIPKGGWEECDILTLFKVKKYFLISENCTNFVL